jgi:hypothetical protein
MHSWPFSLKENGAAINPPLHSNSEIALSLVCYVPGGFCVELWLKEHYHLVQQIDYRTSRARQLDSLR